jgi:hypothetical protein
MSCSWDETFSYIFPFNTSGRPTESRIHTAERPTTSSSLATKAKSGSAKMRQMTWSDGHLQMPPSLLAATTLLS